MSKTVHRHNFKVSAYGNPIWEYRCKCGEKQEHLPSANEKRSYDARRRREDRDGEIIHRVWHDFAKTFMEKESRVWKWTGWELLDRVDKWMKKYPRDVFSSGIDDNHHTSSSVYFILHRVGKRLWGTTAVVVTQCDGQPPCGFFFYPSHMERMRDVFNEIIKKSAPFDRLARMMKRFRAKARRKK